VTQPTQMAPANTVRRGPLRRRVDGVLLLDKPRGLSSNHAMLAARRLLGAAKAGHGGTLDPMASGLLPILLGEATKFAHDLLDSDKTYLATVRLGETSDTGDAEGLIEPTGSELPDKTSFKAVLDHFKGPILQLPPMHSALKHQGRPLYDYARKGLQVDREPRRVVIRQIDLIEFAASSAVIRVVCSKGTYIRTLAQDIGQSAGCGGWLSDLRREAVDVLKLDDSVSLDTLEASAPADREGLLAPLDCLLRKMPSLELDATQASRFCHGQRLRLGSDGEYEVQKRSVYHAGRLLGVGVLDEGVLAPHRLIAAPSPSSAVQSQSTQ
jgi:tRNA pseudouridine55 synthase